MNVSMQVNRIMYMANTLSVQYRKAVCGIHSVDK